MVHQLVVTFRKPQGPAHHSRRRPHWNRLVRPQQSHQRLVVCDHLDISAPQVLRKALNPEHEGEAFLVQLAVLLLCSMKSTARKRHRVFLATRLPVSQDGSQTLRRCTYGRNDRLGRIEVHQHRSLGYELLAALEGEVLFLLPNPQLCISKQKMERL